MTQSTNHFHGSDLEKIQQYFGIKKEDIISFSANVNPLGISSKLRTTLSEHIDAITTYPDRDYIDLRNSISNYVNSDVSHIIVGNGSTELISLFIQIKQPKKAMIIGPTYSEYEREVSMGGGTSLYYKLPETDNFKLDIAKFAKSLNETIDLLIICNPNNPTGTSITRTDMRFILDTCKEYGIFVMVDETYVEFAANMDKITAVPLTNYYNNIIILRGISKFFAAPGLRLGYAICGNKDLLKEINKRKNPWTINTLAAIAGEIMFSDEEYIQKTKSIISKERERICHTLNQISDIKIFEPTANFILIKILKDTVTSKHIFNFTIKHGYMIRDCSTFPFLNNRFLRFCFMLPEQNDKLIQLIKESLHSI